MRTIPPFPRRLSLLTLIYAVILFLWLTPEDSIFLAAILGAIGSALLGAHFVFRRFGSRALPMRVWFPGLIGLGAAVGAGTTLTTTVIMLMKTSLHSHLFPDYPAGVLIGIFERLPAWTLAGSLVGLAAALIISRRP